MNRNLIQAKALELIHTSSVFIGELCTGLGKTKVAIDAIDQIKGSWLIILAETAHIDNWKKEFIEWNKEYLLERCTFVLYASLKKQKGKIYKGIVYDEAHHLFTELRLEASKNIQRDKMILLSATFTNEQLNVIGFNTPNKRFNYDVNKFNITTHHNRTLLSVFLNQALHHKILPNPVIYLIPLTLDNKKLSQEIIIVKGKGAKKVIDVLGNKWVYLAKTSKFTNHTITLKATELGKHNHIQDTYDYFQKNYFKLKTKADKIPSPENLKATKAAEFKWLNLGNQRKKYLSSLKIDTAKIIINHLKGKRFICFASSISEIKELGGDNAIHSKLKNPLSIINKFNNKEIGSLFAVGMLQEGVNLIDIDAGIIVQLSNTDRYFTQILGRTLRSTSPEQYIIYIRNTRDEEYLSKALSIVDNELINEININNL